MGTKGYYLMSSQEEKQTKGKKKRNLKFFTKKKSREGTPGTAPNTPDNLVNDVTVVASEFDPSKPQISKKYDTALMTPRQVNFDAEAETETLSLAMSAKNVTPTTYTNAIMSQTLSFFDDICNASPSTACGRTPYVSRGIPSHDWGIAPSADEDSLYHQGNFKPPTPKSPSPPKSPSRDHENFEVILEPSPPPKPDYTEKKVEVEDEEEKKAEEPEEAVTEPKKDSVESELTLRQREFADFADIVADIDACFPVEANFDKDKSEGVAKEEMSPTEPVKNSDDWNKMLSQLEHPDALEEIQPERNDASEVKPLEEAQQPLEEAHQPLEEAQQPKEKKTRSLTWMAKKLMKKGRGDGNTKAKSLANSSTSTPVKKKKPKTTWKAVVDPNSGRPYYYHRKTRETTWVMPEELRKLEEAKKQALSTDFGEKEKKSNDAPDSPVYPPRVVHAAVIVEEGESPFKNIFDKKMEIKRLLTSFSPPDASAVDKVMEDYEGKEDSLLGQLRAKVESRPFDEPLLDGPSEAPKLQKSTTYLSKASATTKSSTITDKTERIKNTFRGKSLIETISENHSAASSISSHHDDTNLMRAPVLRERALRVEELSNSRFASETFDSKGRVLRGRSFEKKVEPDGGSYFGENEVDTYGSDTVSALSDQDADFLNRKDNFEAARRRALDDAIEREDWELAAALSQGMGGSSKAGELVKAHSSWNQSALDKFIANNDWDSVKSYIGRMRDGEDSKISGYYSNSKAPESDNASASYSASPSFDAGAGDRAAESDCVSASDSAPATLSESSRTSSSADEEETGSI